MLDKKVQRTKKKKTFYPKTKTKTLKNPKFDLKITLHYNAHGKSIQNEVE
jgi:hypothetical protein